MYPLQATPAKSQPAIFHHLALELCTIEDKLSFPRDAMKLAAKHEIRQFFFWSLRGGGGISFNIVDGPSEWTDRHRARAVETRSNVSLSLSRTFALDSPPRESPVHHQLYMAQFLSRCHQPSQLVPDFLLLKTDLGRAGAALGCSESIT